MTDHLAPDQAPPDRLAPDHVAVDHVAVDHVAPDHMASDRVAAYRIAVPFEGEGSGTDELTWGQRTAWRSMALIGVTEWTGGTMPLDDGLTVADMVTMLGFIMSRHQSLRTRLRFDGAGDPWQVLEPAGSIDLEVFPLPPVASSDGSPDASSDAFHGARAGLGASRGVDVDVNAGVDAAPGFDGDVEAVAASIQHGYEAAPWDPTTDWPVRIAVLCRGDRAVHMVALYCHMVIDGYGFEALIRDLANLDYATGRQLGPVVGVQPLQLARDQRGPSAQRQQAATLRYWGRHLRSIEPSRFRERLVPQDERWWEASYTTPATYLALAVLAVRTRVHTGTIILAAAAVALAELSGRSTSVFRVLVSNRFRPGFAESVSNLAEAGLAVIDVAGCTFDEAVERAFKAQLTAGMYAYYDPREVWGLVDRVGVERGTEIDTLCYYNDRRRGAPPHAGPLPTQAEVTAALGASSLRWGPSSNELDASVFLHVNTVPDTIDLTLRVDTTFVSPAGIETALRGIESLLVEAAFDPSLPTGVAAAENVPEAAGVSTPARVITSAGVPASAGVAAEPAGVAAELLV